MFDWILIFMGGVLGTGHCIGMCGGFVLALGSTQTSFRANLRRQIVYAAGRVFTYAWAGAAAGFLGQRATTEFRSFVNFQAILSLVAGVLLIAQGLQAVGFLRLAIPWRRTGCSLASSFGALLTAPGLREVFVAGLMNGFLPCGLVYAYLALASASGNVFLGMAVMVVFGLGTMPSMVLTGLGGTCLSVAARQRIVQVSAACLVIAGCVAIFRGVQFLGNPPCDDHLTKAVRAGCVDGGAGPGRVAGANR